MTVADYVPLEFADRRGASSVSNQEPTQKLDTTRKPSFGFSDNEEKFSGSAEGFDVSIENDSIWKSLDKFEMEMRDVAELQASHREIILNVSRGIGISLTAGYLSWIFSSGSFLASALSSMPMWTKFDPLPILAGRKKKRKRKDVASTRKHSDESDEERDIEALFGDDKSNEGGQGN